MVKVGSVAASLRECASCGTIFENSVGIQGDRQRNKSIERSHHENRRMKLPSNYFCMV